MSDTATSADDELTTITQEGGWTVITYHNTVVDPVPGKRSEQNLLTGARSGDFEMVRRSLVAGVPVDTCHENSCHRTALIVSAMEGYAAIVKLLLEAGADPTRYDSAHMQTPAQWAQWARTHGDRPEGREHAEVIRLLSLPPSRHVLILPTFDNIRYVSWATRRASFAQAVF